MSWEAHAPPSKVAAVMRGFGADWFVAGGWALDLFLGGQTRPHEDVDIAVFRRDQAALVEHLDGWLLQKVVAGEPSPWRRGERLEPPVHEVHGFNESAVPPRLEVLLNETEGDEWVYRRDARVRMPLSRLGLRSRAGVRFLCPEVVLLYKSKAPRERDERDFALVVRRLDAERKGWLREAINVCHPGHPWLRSL